MKLKDKSNDSEQDHLVVAWNLKRLNYEFVTYQTPDAWNLKIKCWVWTRIHGKRYQSFNAWSVKGQMLSFNKNKLA